MGSTVLAQVWYFPTSDWGGCSGKALLGHEQLDCESDNYPTAEVNPDASDSCPMDYAPFLQTLISQRVAVDGGQSASGTGALLLPCGDSGSVLTQVNDNGNGGGLSAEPKARPASPPQRRLRRKTTLTGGSSAGDGRRSVTPPQRRSRDGSDSAAASPS